ncbi:hypothetical protein Hanom_Chr03g00237451 [Helianthus anomalus]
MESTINFVCSFVPTPCWVIYIYIYIYIYRSFAVQKKRKIHRQPSQHHHCLSHLSLPLPPPKTPAIFPSHTNPFFLKPSHHPHYHQIHQILNR